MKLRISGNSIRLRLLRSDVTTFIETGHIEQAIYFATGDQASWVYGLKHESGLGDVEVRYAPSTVTVVVPAEQASAWAGSEQVGIYCAVDLGEHGSLEVIVEKDFACLDLSDAENLDTFPNPQNGVSC